MRATKRAKGVMRELESDPSIHYKTVDRYIGYLEYMGEFECEICGTEPLKSSAPVICSVTYGHEGCGEYWAHRYEVCLDCFKAGVASFPDRLRQHAQELEERARELRKLAADAKWRTPEPHDEQVCAQHGDEDEIPF